MLYFDTDHYLGHHYHTYHGTVTTTTNSWYSGNVTKYIRRSRQYQTEDRRSVLSQIPFSKPMTSSTLLFKQHLKRVPLQYHIVDITFICCMCTPGKSITCLFYIVCLTLSQSEFNAMTQKLGKAF
jgi:hypothetical protein